METVNIPKAEYEKMLKQIALLKEIQKIDIDLVGQFKNSLEDTKSGRLFRVA